MKSLEKCYITLQNKQDSKLDNFATLILNNIREFRNYLNYEVTIEESMRLVNFWKRITNIEKNQANIQFGAALPPLGSYHSHPDAVIAQWIQSSLKHKMHSLPSIADYLQLPVDHLEKYRLLLKRLSKVSEKLEKASNFIEQICKEIEEQKPLAAEARRQVELAQLYNLTSVLPPSQSQTNTGQSDIPKQTNKAQKRRYLGDVVLLLRHETFLDTPSKQWKIPDSIDYVDFSNTIVGGSLVYPPISNISSSNVSTSTSVPSIETDTTSNMGQRPGSTSTMSIQSTTNNNSMGIPGDSVKMPAIGSTKNSAVISNTLSPVSTVSSTTSKTCGHNKSNSFQLRNNPVPKVVWKSVQKSRFTLALYRLIIFDDFVVLTDEDKKKVLRVISRKKISASIPWTYKYSEPPNSNTVYEEENKMGTNRRGALRLMFHDDPRIWYCTIRTFTGGRKSNLSDPRERLSELFELDL